MGEYKTKKALEGGISKALYEKESGRLLSGVGGTMAAGYRYLYLIYKEKGVHLTNRMNSSV